MALSRFASIPIASHRFPSLPIASHRIEQVLGASGDHILDAATFALPERLSLRDAAKPSRSGLWVCLLTAMMRDSLDGGCVGLARNVRRSLRRRLSRLPSLDKVDAARSDSLIATLHINWGSLMLAATGRAETERTVTVRQLEGRITAIHEAQRQQLLTPGQLNAAHKRSEAGLPPTELINPHKTPRQRRLEMHERKLGIFRDQVGPESH